MMTIWRMIDVNVNRAAEGLRVLEDHCKFTLQNPHLTKQLREIRHAIRKSTPQEAEGARLRELDLGFHLSQGSTLDHKSSLEQLVTANHSRVCEALRVIEENYKLLGHNNLSKVCEALRHQMYRLVLWPRKTKVQGIYALTKGETIEALTEEIQRFNRANSQWVQYRDKRPNATQSEKVALATEIRKLTWDYQMTLIINDDVAIALAVGADGVHVGQEDLPVSVVRRIAPHLIVGVSTHREEQLLLAIEEAPDYIALGPLYGTTSKVDVEACEGLAYAKWARMQTHLPLVGIGGIGAKQLPELMAIGLDGFAMISGLKDEEGAQAAAAVLSAHDHR